MTATQLERPQGRSVQLFSTGQITSVRARFSRGPSQHAKSNGAEVLTVTEEAVFRSGTFRDSMGYQHTWEDLHMKQMVLNYEHLKQSGIFEDVPVRKGHGSFLGDPMDSLIGWHTGLSTEQRTSPHDGKDYTYLLATYEIFDEVAKDRIENGHWRNRSSEVGFYITNDEAEYWPAYLGVAYVDIPAVEGLTGFSNAVNKQSVFSMQMEAPVSGDQGNNNQQQGGTAASQAAPGQPAEQQSAEVQQQAGTAPVSPPVERPAETTPAGGQAAPAGSEGTEQNQQPQQGQHGNQARAHQFTIGGRQTSDFSAVQAHITGLENAAQESVDIARADFVTSLANKNLIPAPQLEAMQAFAKGLSDEQYTAWSGTFAAAQPNPLFTQHSGGTQEGGSGEPDAATKVAKQEKDDLFATVRQHKRTMSADKVKATGSYKKLAALATEAELAELGL